MNVYDGCRNSALARAFSYAANGTPFRTATLASNTTVIGFGTGNLTGSVQNFSLTVNWGPTTATAT